MSVSALNHPTPLPPVPPSWFEEAASYVSTNQQVGWMATVAIDADHFLVHLLFQYWDGSSYALEESVLAIYEVSSNTWVSHYGEFDADHVNGFLDGSEGRFYYQPQVGDVTLYVEATPTTVTGTIIPTRVDGIVLADGIWWGFQGDSAAKVVHSWTPVDQWEARFPLYQLDGASASAQTVQTEVFSGNVLEYFTSVAQLGDDVWVACYAPDILASFKNGDEHVRAERQSLNLPGSFGSFCVTRLSATSNKLLVVYKDGGTNVTSPPYHALAAIIEEVPRPPVAVFTEVGFNGDVPYPVTFNGVNSFDYTRDGYWHPITDWLWEFDDGNIGTTGPGVVHTYLRSSVGHSAGVSLTELPPGSSQVGFDNRFLPTLRVASSAGHSEVVSVEAISVADTPYLVGGGGPSNGRFVPGGV